MKDQFVLLLNNTYLNSGIPHNSGQFTADQTFHYIESTLYLVRPFDLGPPKIGHFQCSKSIFGPKNQLALN